MYVEMEFVDGLVEEFAELAVIHSLCHKAVITMSPYNSRKCLSLELPAL